MRKLSLVLMCLLCVGACALAQATQRRYLSGHGPATAKDWEFYCTAGRNAGQWTTIPVPSNWELAGFGNYNYGHEPNKSNEQGRYRIRFRIPREWRGRHIRLVFEGVMTDTQVRVNGVLAGELHQGGFYEFCYDVTALVKFNDENLLEVDVNKVSADASVEDAERQADYWVFGGIYRPVYVEAMPVEHIVRTAIAAGADGQFQIDVHLDGISTCNTIAAQIVDAQGRPVGQSLTGAIAGGQTQCTLTAMVPHPKQWTAETPHLYTVQVSLKRDARTVHTVEERFGFRTLEVRQDGLFLNGRRILLKGVNRHSFRPASGRCLDPADDSADVRLLKSMNMNAVRCSHYPPNRSFLQACDELGLYVLDELAGWQAPPYDTAIGKKLVREMVTRDVNHPCILFWDNGNEGGWNVELDGEFAKYDPSRRPVLHPWAKFSGIDTDHYETYDSTLQKLTGPLLFMPTEFLHGLYDGGHGAGLADYWSAIRSSPFGAGGFLWVLADEGVVRTDLDGKIDTAGNNAPDGIVGPYHQKEASFNTIRQLWSPVQVSFDRNHFDGTIGLENAYDFTNLNQTTLTWQLVNFRNIRSKRAGHTVKRQAAMPGHDLEPGAKSLLRLDLPDKWQSYDALLLTANDPQGHELWTWSLWAKSRPQMLAEESKSPKRGRLKAVTEHDLIRIADDKYEFVFGAHDGLLRRVTSGRRTFELTNGPRRVPAAASEQSPVVACRQLEDGYVVQAKHSGGLDSFCWQVKAGGLLTLDYEYLLAGDYDHFGVTFDLPESSMKSMRWLGQGPDPVWKNRLAGGRIDVWQRDYNQGIPGVVWDYPVFAGCYGDLYWLDLQTQAGAIGVLNCTEELYFRVGALGSGPNPGHAKVSPIEGDLSFLHAISPIGNKFHKADDLGPSGQMTTAFGPYRGQLQFRFD